MVKFLATKNIFSLIKVHPFFYVLVFISLLTGNFKTLIIFMSIILFHELGHITLGLIFKWKIEKIVILPFGGLTIFDEYINRPIFEELLVCVSGPIFQIIYYCIASNFIDIANIHYNLLIFNLLPIVPLDGSKIFNLILNKIFPFRLSYILTNFIAFLISILSFFVIINKDWNLLLFLTIILLIFKTIKEVRNTNYIFNRFLLERYIKHLNLKKTRQIKGLNLKKMYRDYKHVFVYDKKYYTEREIIRKRFDLQRKMW